MVLIADYSAQRDTQLQRRRCQDETLCSWQLLSVVAEIVHGDSGRHFSHCRLCFTRDCGEGKSQVGRICFSGWSGLEATTKEFCQLSEQTFKVAEQQKLYLAVPPLLRDSELLKS